MKYIVCYVTCTTQKLSKFLIINGFEPYLKTNEMNNYMIDSLLKTDVSNKQKAMTKQLENKAKAIIQTYQQCLINNKMR